MKEVGYFIGGIGIFGAITYYSYWVAKNVSYWLFYEDMVKETTMQVLRAQGLI